MIKPIFATYLNLQNRKPLSLPRKRKKNKEVSEVVKPLRKLPADQVRGLHINILV